MNEWVPVKGRIEVVLSNSVPTGSWYWSGTKDIGAKLPKIEIRGLTGCQRDPRELGCSRISFFKTGKT